MNLILASGSPRRQQFLRDLGLAFQVITADIDETPYKDETPTALVERLASSKAKAVAEKLINQGSSAASHSNQPTEANSPWLIIAADTIVALEGKLLGKPTDDEHAANMLTQLRNRPHQVLSGFTLMLVDPTEGIQQQQTQINQNDVYMREYSDVEIAEYIASGDPKDKAGAYAIQHPAFAPVERMEGCISGVMGLPLADLSAALGDLGVSVQCQLTSICEQYVGFVCCQRSGAVDEV